MTTDTVDLAERLGVREGTIFESSWGYDQTNIDFYEVVSVAKSGKSVVLQQVGSHRQDEFDRPQVRVVPNRLRKVGDPFRRKLHDGYRGEAWISITSYSGASIWDGTPGRETGAGWGH